MDDDKQHFVTHQLLLMLLAIEAQASLPSNE